MNNIISHRCKNSLKNKSSIRFNEAKNKWILYKKNYMVDYWGYKIYRMEPCYEINYYPFCGRDLKLVNNIKVVSHKCVSCPFVSHKKDKYLGTQFYCNCIYSPYLGWEISDFYGCTLNSNQEKAYQECIKSIKK